MYTPAGAARPVPVILLVNFGGGPPRVVAPGATPGAAGGQPVPGQGRGNVAPGEPPVAAEILARGWGYATVGYADIQPDRANTFNEGVIGLTSRRADEAGAGRLGHDQRMGLGISRIIDYFETDIPWTRSGSLFRASRGLARPCSGRPRMDQRIAAVFSSCAGEMGAVARAPRLGRDRRRHGAELRLAVRSGDSRSGWAAGTTCRSMRTC